MTSDDLLALLARENPIDERDLPRVDSASVLALRERILASEARPGRPRSASAAQRTGRRRMLALRIAVVGAAVTGVAVGALSVLPGGPQGSLVEQASAADAAIAVLAGRPNSIVHLEATVRQTSGGETVASWHTESWQKTSPPYDRRERTIRGDGTRIQTATVNGTLQSYDAATNTIVIDELGLPENGDVPPGATPPPATAEPFRDQVLSLLRAGKLRETGRTRVEGREAISFSWNDGHTTSTYVVDASTHDPIRWELRAHDGSTTAVTFSTYELLVADDTLVNLATAYPEATITREPGE